MAEKGTNKRRSQRLFMALDVDELDETTHMHLVKSSNARTVREDTVNTSLKRKLDHQERDAANSPRKSQKTYVKDEVHWLLDGNLHLQIGKTRFKVHRSRLASESPWFQALVEQRAGDAPDIPSERQDAIDKAIASVERLGDHDLYFLDFVDGPNATQFAAMLTAMQYGIDYVYKTPSFSTMTDIYEASHFFLASRYRKFSETYLKKMFEDSWESIPLDPSPYAARALIIGTRYGLESILRRCYYDLARTHPIPIPIADVVDDSNPSVIDLQRANSTIFFYLLNAQRHLALAWDKIRWALTDEKFCNVVDCTSRHSVHTFVGSKTAKMDHPFDPITGMNAMLETASEKTGYCEVQETRLEEHFEAECNQIWENMKTWLDIL